MTLPVPDDAVADVLRRLPPRSLAAARCVCKAWRALVDGRALLRPHLLPHSVHGVVVNYIDHCRPHLFSRPSSSAAAAIGKIDGNFTFMPNNDGDRDWWSVLDHCDGLLLCGIEWGSQLCVCNPATRRWETLPAREEPSRYAAAYLAFDPAASPDYEVLLIPNLPEKPSPPVPHRPRRRRPKLRRQDEVAGPFCLDMLFSPLDAADESDLDGDGETRMDDDDEEEVATPPSSVDDDQYSLMEWPPSPYLLKLFSSRSGQWEDRAFVREGEKVTTVEEMLPLGYSYRGPRRGYSVYCHGSLYVHCRGAFVTRYSLSNGKYQVIETPINMANYKWEKPYLGKSEMGVLFGMIHGCQLSVWILHESAGQMGWILSYQHDLRPFAKEVRSLTYDCMTTGPWTVEEDSIDMHENRDTISAEDFEWDSDNDDFLAFEVRNEEYDDCAYFDILGFHPYKEVIFLDQSFGTIAYHLNSSKIQYLGYSRPKCYYRNYTNGIYESFLYTPCMIGELHGVIGQSSSEE
uniref:F-box domain-containing protein n=1 Tax=Oryza punctata TaxID=4537 RepID=A0A0E0MHG1_ORYPU